MVSYIQYFLQFAVFVDAQVRGLMFFYRYMHLHEFVILILNNSLCVCSNGCQCGSHLCGL